MNKVKNISDSQLQKLFKESFIDEPSPEFGVKLMERIEKETRIAKRKSALMVYWQIAAGIVSIILLPALVIYLCNLLIPGFSFSMSLPKFNLHIDPRFFVMGFSILLLLIADTLCRKHLRSKNKIVGN
jgi:hypothetical protein